MSLGRVPLDPREARLVEGAARALALLPARAPLADIFDAMRPCVPLAAGLFHVLRPSAPDAMVTHTVRLPLDVLESWMGTPHEQLAQTLAPVIQSRAGDLWRDSETVTGALREQLEVLRRLDAAGLGEGLGYKVLERPSTLHGREHMMLAMILERGASVPAGSRAMLAALNPAITATLLRLGLPFLETEPILAQIVAERSIGYVCVSRTGTVLEANRRARELVMRYRGAARIDGARAAMEAFAGRARTFAGRGQAWRLHADGPPSVLEVSTHLLAKETHPLPEDVVLLVMNEVLLLHDSRDALLERAKLSPQEKKIALLLADTAGSYKEIAAGLSRSEGTIRTHAERLYRKLGVRSRPELTALLK